jgi:hypothetical protein
MSIEDRKIYNEKYYATNKKRITDMLSKKTECPLCHRQISHSNLQRHQTTPLCIRNRKNSLSEIDILRQQIDKLTQEMNTLKSN